MTPGTEEIALVFELDALRAEVAARLSVGALGLQDSQVSLYEQPMKAALALEEIARAGEQHFGMNADGAAVDFGTIRGCRLQLLTICMKEDPVPAAWEKIAAAFFGCAGFVQACVMNEEYTFWQNAKDPLEYQAAGRSHAGLPLVSNGLPSPLRGLVIDTSGNPGRRILKTGYIEMVGRAMWFAQSFWSLVGDHRRVSYLRQTAYRVVEIENGITSVFVPGTRFIDETSADVQDDLRRRLYL